MNILEVEDMVKGMPDEALQREAQQPTGQLPQFLVISEIQRRSDMRRRYQAQQEQPQSTIKDQILQGIGGMVPQQMRQDLAPQQGAPQMGMPAQPGGMGAPAGAPMQAPVQMASGGLTRMQNMGQVPGLNQQELIQRAQSIGLSLPQITSALQSGRLQELIDQQMATGLPSLAGPTVSMPTPTMDAVALDLDRNYDQYNELERLGAQVASIDPPMTPTSTATPAGVTPSGIASIDDREPPPGQGSPGLADRDQPPPPPAVNTGFTTQGLMEKATERTIDPTMMALRDLLAAQEQRGSVDYSAFGTKVEEQQAARTKEAEARVSELLKEAEKETGELSKEARRDAMAQALIQFGAGIASGDISSGLEKAGTTAYAITAKARDEARDRMRQARAEGRSAMDAARAAGDAAFNTMLQLDMKTEEGKVAAANALRDNRNNILTEIAKRAGDIESEQRQMYATLSRTTAAIEQAAVQRATEELKTSGLNKRSVIDLVQDVVKSNKSLIPADATADSVGQLVANIALSVASKLGIDMGELPDGDAGETRTRSFENFSGVRMN